MNVFKSLCRVHDGMPIVNVCVSGNAAVALCAKCLNDHIKQHRTRGIECNLLDTRMFINQYEVERAETCCKVEQAIVKLVQQRMIQADMECSAKKFTASCLAALEQTRSQVIALVENSFRGIRNRLEGDCNLVVKDALRELRLRKEELDTAHRNLKHMVGVEGLTVFVTSDRFVDVLTRAGRTVLGHLLPEITFTSEIERQLKEVLQGCVSPIKRRLAVQEELGLARSTWMDQAATASQWKCTDLENTRESSFTKSNSRGFDEIKQFITRPASCASLHKSSWMQSDLHSRPQAIGPTIYTTKPLQFDRLKKTPGWSSSPKVPLVFGDRSPLLELGNTKRSVHIDEPSPNMKQNNQITMSFVENP